MDIYIVAIVIAVIIAITVYELATGYAFTKFGFRLRFVSRVEQPVAYWALIGLKLVVLLYIVWRRFGVLKF